jgi:hypothetical protein
MAGTLVIDTLTDGSGNTTSATNAIRGSAKAWVNFNGSTAAIRASFNVSSVVRNSTGDYTINFTNALADANYAVTGAARWTTSGVGQALVNVKSVAGALAASSAKITTCNPGGPVFVDFEENCIAVFR